MMAGHQFSQGDGQGRSLDPRMMLPSFFTQETKLFLSTFDRAGRFFFQEETGTQEVVELRPAWIVHDPCKAMEMTFR